MEVFPILKATRPDRRATPGSGIGARRVVRAAALPLLALLVAACGGEKGPPPQEAVPVVLATAVRRPAPDVVAANGTVEPIQTVQVESQVSGVLTDVLFHEGQDVSAGQPLFRVDPRPYQAALGQAEAALARDLAQAKNSQRDAERYQALVDQDYVTRAQADAAAATAAAQAATVQADSAAVEAARLNLAYTSIRAPMAGRTGSLLVHQGNLVKTSGSPLVVINQIDPILVRFTVPEQVLAQVRRYGAAQPLEVEAAPSPGTTVQGKLTFVDNAVDPQTGTVMLKAEFPNRSGLLWPGEYVPVRLQLYVQENALVVPSAAVNTDQDGSYVFVVDDSGVAHRRNVKVGRILEDDVTLESGLQGGERVVTDGQSRLSEGAKVTVRTAQTSGAQGAGASDAAAPGETAPGAAAAGAAAPGAAAGAR